MVTEMAATTTMVMMMMMMMSLLLLLLLLLSSLLTSIVVDSYDAIAMRQLRVPVGYTMHGQMVRINPNSWQAYRNANLRINGFSLGFAKVSLVVS